MAKLHVESWSDERRWVGDQSWPLEAFIYRLGICTTLKGTVLKRTARALMKRELSELDEVNAEAAGALIHMLESLGAKIAISE